MEKLTLQSTIAEALKNPKAVEVIERVIPGITKNPAIRMVSRFPLEKITHVDQLGITLEKLTEMLKDVNGD